MTTVINTNVPAIIAKSNMDRVQRELESSIAKLSSGSRINKAADDAAGMAVANRMESQIRGLTMAVRHAKDGQNLIDTADGAAIEVSNILQRLRELAVQASSDTLDTNNRTFLNAEATALKNEINRISAQTRWNNLNLIDGTYAGKLFQVGFKGQETIDVTIEDASTTAIGAYNMHSEAYVGPGEGHSITATTLTITGYLGSTTVSVPVTSTVSNSSVERAASDINAVTELTGVEASAVTKAELYSVSKTGSISFKMMGNRPNSGAETNYKFDISAEIADTSDLSPLITAINAQSANTGITAAVGATAASIILTHATGEDIEIDTFVLDTTTSGNMSMRALDKYGNNLGAADLTLNRTLNTALDDTMTVGSGSANGLAVGHMTLTSIKSFVVTGDDTTAEEGYFDANNYSGSSAGGGSARLSAVSGMSLDTQEHATDAIAVLDGAIAKIDSSRASMGAISNRLSHVADNNTAMITNTESSKSHILDTDFAKETTTLTRTQILQQAATSMLAQANASKQSVLALLQNL
jgi:flagellin